MAAPGSQLPVLARLLTLLCPLLYLPSCNLLFFLRSLFSQTYLLPSSARPPQPHPDLSMKGALSGSWSGPSGAKIQIPKFDFYPRAILSAYPW